MKEKVIKFINDIIDPTYFNIKKLIKYLEEHEIVGEEIFDYICLSNWDKYWGINEKNGYQKINTDVFIRRLPFYTYFDDVNKESINIFFEVYPKKLDNDMIEKMYSCFEYLYYEEKLMVKDIIKFVRKSKAQFSLFDGLVNYVDYCKLNKKYEANLPIQPNNFLFTYNLLLEKAGRKPVIYFFDRNKDNDKYYKKNKNIISFDGYIPIDNNGLPNLKWLGIKGKNIDIISCKVDSNSYGTLEIEVNKLSIVKIFLQTVDGLATSLVYTSPKYIIVDGESLFKYRQVLGLTRKDVYEMTDISPKTLENWEKNNRNPNGSDLLKLLSLYGIKDYYSIIDKNAIDSRLDDTIEFGVYYSKL